VELYLHSPIRLHGVVLTLPLPYCLELDIGQGVYEGQSPSRANRKQEKAVPSFGTLGRIKECVCVCVTSGFMGHQKNSERCRNNNELRNCSFRLSKFCDGLLTVE
jgi:hypothetical protein